MLVIAALVLNARAGTMEAWSGCGTDGWRIDPSLITDVLADQAGRPAGLPLFADQAHLTRWFRRCYGLTPGAYQRTVVR